MATGHVEDGGGGRGPASTPESALVFEASALREVDRLAVERYGLPTCVLMENAACALAREVLRRGSSGGSGGVVVLCGPGNNGGDGLAAARHLHNAGVEVLILTTPEGARSPDARLHLGVARAIGLAIREVGHSGLINGAPLAASLGIPGVVVDALLGTGLDRTPDGAVAAMIDWCHLARSRGAVVVSADIPSGLEADTGHAPGACVRADVTVTFVGLKKGFLALEAQALIGEVVIADIGVPRKLAESLGHATPLAPHPGVGEADPPPPTPHARHPGPVE